MKYIFVDFETFYDTKQKYDLGHMSIVEYIRDPRFKVLGCAMGVDTSPISWARWPVFQGEDLGQIAIVGHNIKFDGLILSEKYGVDPTLWIDTKAMAKAVLGKTVKGHSLRELAEHYGLEPKGELKVDGLSELTSDQEKELAEYCIHDAELCREIFLRLKKDFPENQYTSLDWTIRTFVKPKLVLNAEVLKDANKEESERRNNIFGSIGIPKKIFASNAKFTDLLRKEGYEVPTKTSPRTGKAIPAFSKGDVAFTLLLERTEDARLKALMEARVAAKSTLLETRTANLAAIAESGPWPFDVEFSGAMQTHRYSGGSGAGGNPQNFTKDSSLRRAVEAPEGHMLVVGDFSNIELRLVAYLSKDAGLIQALEQNKDLYCDFASAFYGETVTKRDEKRRTFGKTAILGLGYNMGAEKFKNTVKLQTKQIITDDEAKRAVNLYRRKYIRVPALWANLQDTILNMTKPQPFLRVNLPISFELEGMVLPSGLKIQYPNLRQVGVGRYGNPEWGYDVWKKKTEKETVKLYGGKVLENICQGLAGELCKEVLNQFKEYAVGQVHDEIHLVVSEDEADAVAEALQKAMETPPKWLPQMKLEAEVKIGKNWKEAKKV